MVKSHSITIALISLFMATCLTSALMAAEPDKPAVTEPRTAVSVVTESTDAVDVKVTPRCGVGEKGTAEVDLQRPPQEIFEALPRFGANLFAAAVDVDETEADSKAQSAGAPVANAPVPPNYVVGPGDQLSLRVSARGWEQLDHTLTVSAEGFVFPPQLGKVTAAGQTLAGLRQVLAEAYGRVYAEPTVTLVVSEQRTVEVYVTGDAMRPGKYALVGTATVFTALYAAGGPSEIGSFRRLQLNRVGQKAVEIDLYDYLLTGRRDKDVLLQPGDTLFIPPVQAEVGLAGQVRRPGRYELRGEVTVAEAIEMAGGLKPTAYGPVVQLWQTAGRSDWVLVNINVSDPASTDLQRPIKDGDVLVVNEILPQSDNVAKVFGAVKRPGYYPVGADSTVGSILRAAEGMVGDAHMGRGLLTRLDDSRHVEMISFDVREQYYGGAEVQIRVQPKDWIRIFGQDEVEPANEVEIRGVVAKPGSYQWMVNMRVSDLLLQAGGALPEAYMARADLLRLTPDNTYEVIAVSLHEAIDGKGEADIVLQRGDILTVMPQEEAGPASLVHVAGYVGNPGDYARREGMRVSDAIFAAGGLKPGAGPAVELTRGRFEGKPNTVTLRLIGGPEQYTVEPDTVLSDDDTVSVTGRGDFKAHADLIYLQGRVAKPGSYVIKGRPGREPYTVFDLLEDGDGLLEDANPNGIVVYRRHGAAMGKAQAEDLERLLKSVNQETRQPTMQVDTAQQASAMNATVAQSLGSVFSSPSGVSIVLPPRAVNPEDWVAAIPVDGAELFATRGKSGNMELEPGDTVVVPRRINTVTVLGAVPRSGAVPYVKGRNCAGYINASGGFREDAAGERMVVVHANGSAAPINLNTSIQPGDVIVVPTKHIVRTVRTESKWQQWFKSIVTLATAALVF